MCRLLGYLGLPTPLDRLLIKPDHSLLVQSYQPKEMTAGLLNADGFGVGWYHPQHLVEPYTYKSILPAWNDINLPDLSRYVESGCVLANVRSATPGLPLDFSNCQPFKHRLILGVHNGFIENFRQTLYRPLRDRLCDQAYQLIQGSTDSEHLFALVIDQLLTSPGISLREALQRTLTILADLANQAQIRASANILLSDGQQLVACRFACNTPNPSLYWLRDDPSFPQAVVLASEPLFEGNWLACPEHSLVTVDHDLNVQVCPL